MALLDRNTDMPMAMPGLAATVGQNTTGSQTAGPRTDSTTSTVQEKTSSAVTQASSQINTTPGALAALEQLITQLSDRPNISPAELDAKFPLARMEWTGNGWVGKDPKTGMTMDAQQMQQFNAQQTVRREQAVKAAGTTAGGTEQQKATSGERQTEIGRSRAQQDKYSKEAAFNDADFLINKSITDALEAALPQITAGLEGAGTSKSTMGAALTQKAALKGATEGGALGANLSVQYGQINNQLEGVLEMLTRQDPNSPAALLLQAIIGSKGLVSAGVNNQAGTTTGTKTQQTLGTQGPQTTVSNQVRNPIMPAMQPLTGLNAATPAQTAANPYYAFTMNDNSAPTSAMDSTYQELFSSPGANELFSPEEEEA